MQENAEAVRRLYEAFNRRDTATTRELMDPDIEYVNPEDAVERGTRKGFDQYQVALGKVREIFGDAEIEVDRVVESGDRVAAKIRMRVLLDARGFDTVVDQSHLWTFRDGKAVRFEWFTDPQRALETLADTSSGTP
ncbi:MAG TPA: nuclear transport factor 2 family protein [Solirubrobacterales bacterium]|jgi:ketosteroid isomerase-like protein|nr:nuclear transport factor 2 family protein [Solirubrobacterales bacterium]